MSLANENQVSVELEVFVKLISKNRDISQSLRSPDFTNELFNDAVRRSLLKVKYLPGIILPGAAPENYGQLYRFLQECLTNGAKHAGSCRVYIEFQG